jgi:hypothetical protein
MIVKTLVIDFFLLTRSLANLSRRLSKLDQMACLEELVMLPRGSDDLECETLCSCTERPCWPMVHKKHCLGNQGY